ncbi:hypothetical protein [Candidatus Viridilinea mediisalina]|uniref:hypothetical protein n=1 Tax=Candidatus Viridilinea mediisalina TaxID=2024553 RepID=UPI000F5AAFD1|nr:hypothetical protein [Candidatus Viridilinea mediisalina]
MIKSRVPGGASQLADALASLIALELLVPGGRLYLISPHLGDMVLLKSPFGQFRALMPELGRSAIRLGESLGMLAARGTQVRVLYRPGDPDTDAFVAGLTHEVARRAVSRLDERGLISEHFYLRGSLEFDRGGISTGDESVEISTEPDDVARALLDAEQLWRRS